MVRDLTKPSRGGRCWVKNVLALYVHGMISDNDYRRLETELLDIISAERGLALRAPKRNREKQGK